MCHGRSSVLEHGISRSNLDMHAHNMNSMLLLNQARAVADNNKGSHHESTATFFAVNKDQSKNIKDKKKIEKLKKYTIKRVLKVMQEASRKSDDFKKYPLCNRTLRKSKLTF